MKPLRNILAIVDPTVAVHPEIDKAALLARRYDARLRLFICDTKAMREARLLAQHIETPDVQTTSDLPKMLDDLAAPLRKQGLTVATTIETAPTLQDGLLSYTGSTDADLVVKETHHYSLLQRTLLTNTDWQLIRHCPVPLLLTKANPWYAAPTVLAAVDPGHAADKSAALDHAILDLGVGLSGQLGGTLQIVHAFLPLAITAPMTDGMTPLAISITPDSLAQEEAVHRQRLLELAHAHGIAEAAVKIVVGTAGERLPAVAADLHADILVLGAVARGKLERLLIGSTAERVLERLPCDALIVKPPDFAAARSL